MKVFISQPMTGKPKKDIMHERKCAMDEVKRLLGKDCEFIDAYNPKSENPLEDLGRCIMMMADADAVYLAPGWSSSFGCTVERSCALHYNKRLINSEVK